MVVADPTSMVPSPSEGGAEGRASIMGSTADENWVWGPDDGGGTALRDFLLRLPKVELHAHLNGCVRESTLIDLARERGVSLCPRLFPSLQLISAGDAAAAAPTANEFSARTVDSATIDHASSLRRGGSGSSSPAAAAFYRRRPRSLSDCFGVFREMARVVDDLEALQRVATEALEDFAHDGTAYLELRSTPKRLRRRRRRPQGGSSDQKCDPSHLDDRASKREYVETILAAMDEFERREPSVRSHRPMRCRLLVAIDRSRPVEEAQEHVELAISFASSVDSSHSPRRVVGIDVGGDPCKGDLRAFFPLLRRARNAGLFVTLHCAEINCGGDDDPPTVDGPGRLSDSEWTARNEVEAILERKEFVPDRIGHALLLPPRLQVRLLELGIPVETCPTSNVMTLELAHAPSHGSGVGGGDDDDDNNNNNKSNGGSFSSRYPVAPSVLDGLRRHPQLPSWLENDHPLAICTDDPGVFGTTLSREWELVLRANASRLLLVQNDDGRTLDGAADEDPTGHCHRRSLRRRVAERMARTMDFAFCDDGVKDEVRMRILDFVDEEDR